MMRKKPRVALVCEYFPHSDQGEARGGVEVRIFEIARRLVDIFDVHVIASKEVGTKDNQVLEGVSVHRLLPERAYTQSGHLIGRFHFMRCIIQEMFRIRPDIIDAQSLVTYLPSIKAGKQLTVPTVATIHDLWRGRWVKLFGVAGIIGELYEWYTLRQLWTLFIANSLYTKAMLVTQGINSERIHVIHNGIDLKEIGAVEVVKFGRPTICSITRLVSYKRTIDLISAVDQVRKVIPDIQVKIIGSGPQLSVLKRFVDRHSLRPYIDFMGFLKQRSEVLRVLKASHVFCLPSSVEGFGIVVAEAMAAGIPCVVTDIPALKEVISNGVAGFIYPVGNVDQLAKGLLVALSDKQKSEQWIRAGREVIKAYQWDVITQKTSAVYQSII